MLVTAVLIGLGLSVGLIVILRMSVFPKRVPMEKILSDRMVVAEKGTDLYAAANPGLRDLYTATSRRLEGRLDLTSKSGTQLKKDLALVGKSARRHSEHKMISSVAAALFGVIIGLGITSGISIPFAPFVVTLIVILFALIGLVIPDSLLKTQAKNAREEFDELMLSWLDLVMPLIASGRDVSAAFLEASALSRAWPFQMLGQHMNEARHLGKPIWAGLRKMIDEKGLDRLEQLASALELSQRSGAELRQTVVAQVHSYRNKAHSDALVMAEFASERMGAPLALALAAFIVLIGYPAIDTLFSNTDVFDIPSVPDPDGSTSTILSFFGQWARGLVG